MRFTSLLVTDIIQETADAVTLCFAKPELSEFQHYKAGQYLTLKFQLNGESVRRAYSLCSAPEDKDLRVTVKKVANGLVSSYINEQLRKGDTVEVMPPMGNFVFEPDATRVHHYILIAGGSGITPMMSILKTILSSEPFSYISLIYSNWTEESIIFRKSLEKIEREHKDKLRVLHILDNPTGAHEGITGRMSGDTAKSVLKEATQRHQVEYSIYLCGPNALMDEVLQAAELLKISKENIKKEVFTTQNNVQLPDTQLITRQVKVVLDGMPHTLTVKAGQTVLDSAIDAKLDPPFACQEGTCCTCRALLQSGAITLTEREGLSDAELEDGYVLTCQCYPLTDDVELEFG